MDEGLVPQQDRGSISWEQYPTEMYAELFAFLSLISSSQTVRDDYAERARTLLMYVIDRAALGAAIDEPFRDPRFSTSDRSRWQGEAFALTVDWIYPYLTTTDKDTIRRVFLRWVDENLHATTTSYNHPEPVCMVNDPTLINETIRTRFSANNYYTAHMRNIGLMSMALDPDDDPDGELRSYLGNATGAWLYVVDHLLRTDARGGLWPEGFEYGPQSMGYVTQFLLALHTAGQDDPDIWGPQVVFGNNPFWADVLPAYLNSLSPATTTHPWLGQVYQPAWYGDGQDYWAGDSISGLGPLGIYAAATGDTAQAQAVRWVETNLPPGGSGRLSERVARAQSFTAAIFYFLLLDPNAGVLPDPYVFQPMEFYAPGIGHVLGRTGWDLGANWFTYALGWNSIDHQHDDGNHFEFYRRGEWLTKDRTGYGLFFGASDNHNTLALENDPPLHNDPGDYRHVLWARGSQWPYFAAGDGHIMAHSFSEDFVYALGDATDLYNSAYELTTDITHASRSIVWLKPDHIVIYDRASSHTAGRFKRFWLQLPAEAAVSGNRAIVTTRAGQHLFVTNLLPVGAIIQSVLPDAQDGTPANEEPMQWRLRVESPTLAQDVRFLNVLQGADPSVSADTATLVQSNSGMLFSGVVVDGTAVLFPVNVQAEVRQFTYIVSNTTTAHIVTGLVPNGEYSVVSQPVGSEIRVTIAPGAGYQADSGGVVKLASQPQPPRRFYMPLISRLLPPAGETQSSHRP